MAFVMLISLDVSESYIFIRQYTSRECLIQNFHKRATDILYTITCCFSGGGYGQILAKAAGDIFFLVCK